MHADEILAAINGQISQLQQARALLTDNDTRAQAGKKRGRPKGSGVQPTKALSTSTGRAGKRTMSAEGKAKIAAAQKARWAAQKKTTQPAAKKTVAHAKKSERKPVKKSAPAKKANAAPRESPSETTTKPQE